MTTGTIGGMIGKARIRRTKDQDERRFAESLIEDYYEPRAVRRRSGGDAPIRGRSEFAPCALAEMVMSDQRTGRQLELDWTEMNDETESSPSVMSGRNVVWSTGTSAEVERDAVALIPTSAHVDVQKENDLPKLDAEQISDAATATTTASRKSGAGEFSVGTRILRVERPRRTSMPLGWSQTSHVRSERSFTIRGFVRGCAIGGVAAAVALTVLRIALG